jgi:hypothetical protein
MAASSFAGMTSNLGLVVSLGKARSGEEVSSFVEPKASCAEGVSMLRVSAGGIAVSGEGEIEVMISLGLASTLAKEIGSLVVQAAKTTKSEDRSERRMKPPGTRWDLSGILQRCKAMGNALYI